MVFCFCVMKSEETKRKFFVPAESREAFAYTLVNSGWKYNGPGFGIDIASVSREGYGVVGRINNNTGRLLVDMTSECDSTLGQRFSDFISG